MTKFIKFKAASDVGCVRTNNEDMAYVAGRLVRDAELDGELSDIDISDKATVAFAVADGMGGYEGGEVASEIVCRSFASFIRNFTPADNQDVVKALKSWAIEANSLVNDTASIRPGLSEMGTTFIGLVFTFNKLWLINIGDSRCYRLRNGILKQLSVDHSEKERTGNPDVPSNLIYNFMGNTPECFISDVTELTPIGGDSYLLCSDGLSDMIDDEKIEEHFNDVDSLVLEAKKAGGRDNITAVCISL